MSRNEKWYGYAVMAVALVAVGWYLLGWRDVRPDAHAVSVTALLLVPVAVRFQVTISRGSVDLTAGAAGVALFGAAPSQQASTLPIWALLILVSYAVLPSDRPGRIVRAGIHVLGGTALVKVADIVEFGYQPYSDVFFGVMAYILVIAAIEIGRRFTTANRTREHLLLNLRWAFVLLVAITIYYIGVIIAVLRRFDGGVNVPVVPALVAALAGAFVVSVGFAVRTMQLNRSLHTVAEAAVAMPWQRASINDSARSWTERAMRTSEVRVTTSRPSRGISAPFGDGQWLLARRDAGDLPFSAIEQRVLQALASMGSSSIRRADADDHLNERASSDSLSGLPTYTTFRDRLDRLSDARDEGEQIGVLFIDLDDFKSVNDTYGHLVGDEVIRTVAGRLRSFAGDDGLLTRFGGDEFALVRRHVEGVGDLQVVAAELLHVFTQPMVLDDVVVNMAASVGVALSVSRDDDLDLIMRSADREMYASKSGGSDRAKLRIDNVVRSGIIEGRVTVAFQPIVMLDGDQIRGWEALARLHDVDLGDIPPMTIVGVAKRLGLLDELTTQIADQAFDTLVAIRPDFGLPVSFSINFERDQLVTWTPTLEHLFQRSQELGIPVAVEISERSFDQWSPANTAVVERIRGSGGTVSLDDFGTGFAALGALHLAPVHVVKLDRSMVDGMGGDRQVVVLRRVIGLLHELGFRVVVEGIEQAVDAVVVKDLGVEFGQGFFYGKPISAGELADRCRLHGAAGII